MFKKYGFMVGTSLKNEEDKIRYMDRITAIARRCGLKVNPAVVNGNAMEVYGTKLSLIAFFGEVALKEFLNDAKHVIKKK